MSDLPNLPDAPEAEATPLAHRFDASYPEVPPVPPEMLFEPDDAGASAMLEDAPAAPGSSLAPETVVAAGSALAVAATLNGDSGSESAPPLYDDMAEDDLQPQDMDLMPWRDMDPLPQQDIDPLSPPDLPESDASREPDVPSDEVPASMGALAGAAPGDSEAFLALLETENESEPPPAPPEYALILEDAADPVDDEIEAPPGGERFSPEAAPDALLPDLPDAPEPLSPDEMALEIEEFVRLEPPMFEEDAQEPEDDMPEFEAQPEAEPEFPEAAVLADAPASAGDLTTFEPPELPELPGEMGVAGLAATQAELPSVEVDVPQSEPVVPPEQVVPPETTVSEPATHPVGPHFRTDICPRCGQPDFSKGTVLSYGRDFRPAYYKPAGLSWRRLRSMLRPFRHLIEVEAQVCRHCGLVSLQVDTDALERIEKKFGG